MAAPAAAAGGIALNGAPDFDDASNKHAAPQAMHLELSQDLVDELLESLRSGKTPQLVFGRTPQLKFGTKSHNLQSGPENYRNELYKSSGPGSDDQLEFAGLISHRLAVQRAEETTAGVDAAIEQLRTNMAAAKEAREANKTIVGDAARLGTPTHRRVPSKGFKPAHLAPSAHGSPLLSAPNSPMIKPPTSQPAGGHDLLLRALRVPLIHLLAVQPARDSYLAETCRTPLANVQELLNKIAKRSSDPDIWQLTDKSFKELNPWKFSYKSPEDREQAINNAVKSFDRLRLPKDDNLWQILLPVEERGQGKCLSRLNVKAPEPQKPSTPLHKLKLGSDKKSTAAKKGDDKKTDKPERKPREVKVKEPTETRPRKIVNNKAPERTIQDSAVKRATNAAVHSPSAAISTTPEPSSSSISTATRKPTAPSHRHTPSADKMAPIRQKKVMVPKKPNPAPRADSKMSSRDSAPQKARDPRPAAKITRPVSTKPKNPSPLSASPPVNASDFEETHPVHKALSGAPSPAKTPANSDRSLKRKANDIDSNIHNHYMTVKHPRVDRTPITTPSTTTTGRGSTATPSSASSLKRKSDSADDSSSADSPVRLSFRQTVELSQQFQRYYKRYEELYWKLADSPSPPTDAQRSELMKMHKKLENMKREINDSAEGR